MKVYYAHPISMYGSKQEAEDIEFLKLLGLIVCNPAKLSRFVESMSYRMKYFAYLVGKCDCLAYRSFDNGKIGSGVQYEIAEMVCKRGYVFELIPNLRNRILTIDETREQLRHCKREQAQRIIDRINFD